MMNENVTISVTGHRPVYLFGYEANKYISLFNCIKSVFLKMLSTCNTLSVTTGGAQGVDQVAFWAAYMLKTETGRVYTKVVVPFKGQEKSWKEKGTFGRLEYHTMLQNADNVTFLANEYRSPRQYTIRDMYMVDNSNILLSVLNPNNINEKSGTQLTTEYAMSKGVPVISLNPVTLETQYPSSLLI